MGGLEEKKKMGPELGSIWRRELGGLQGAIGKKEKWRFTVTYQNLMRTKRKSR